MREDGQAGGQRVEGVAAEFGGDEALDSGGDGGGEQGVLLAAEGGRVQGGDDGVLAFQGAEEGGRVGVVDGLDVDAGWEGAASAGVAVAAH